MSDPSSLQVFCTIDSEPRARELAQALVDARVAACVQVVGPIHSTYRWAGATETADEWLLLMKTSSSRFDALRREIVERHPYDVPEVVAVPIVEGARPYLDWIASSTS